MITFNKKSKIFIEEIINKEFSDIIILDNAIEQKLKTLVKIIKLKIKDNNNDNNKKSFELRKKIFNNIKTFLFAKKDIKLEYN